MKARCLLRASPGIALILLVALMPAVSAASVFHYGYIQHVDIYDPSTQLYVKGVEHYRFQVIEHGDGTVTVFVNHLVNAVFRDVDGKLASKYSAHMSDHQNAKAGTYHMTFTHTWKVPGFGYILQEMIVFNFANGEIRVFHVFP